MKKIKQSFYILLSAMSAIGFAQELKMDSPIPMDPTVKTGKLKNGLTYYIKKNSKPENKVDLRLMINAGSILETDEQQGLAHFMEHMCFNGTKRFPKNKLVDYLQSIGVKFGQHLNAYTSFDETVYFLPIPSDDKEKLEKGFQIIEDWAFNTTLTPEEIDKERGVVLEEYRLGLGADKRMMGRFMPKMMYNSQYAKRLPIGQKEILENFTYDKLTSFYKDWYRPNLMSVVVVGDIDVAEMEKKIKDHFSSYKNPKKEKPRKMFEVPNHKETFIAVESDKEAAFSQVRLLYKDYTEPKKTVTVGDFRTELIEGLFSTMLNNRLEEKQNSPTPPFTYGYTYHGGTFARNKEAFQSFAMVAQDKQLDALKVLIEENERVRKYGFTESELERAKTKYLNQVERQYNERDKTESENYVWAMQSNFLEQEPAPSIEWTFAAMKQLLPTISIKETNDLISKYIKEDNRVVILTGPEKEGVAKPTEKDVLEAMKIDEKALKPYEETAVAESLLRNPVKKGKVVKTEKNDKLDVTTFTLSNGAKVIYKKTDFKNDEIMFQALSFGGSNTLSNEDYKKVSVAMGGLTEAGFSGMNKNDINKFMTGKIARVNPFVSSTVEGMRGSSTPKDFEYLMQMIHAYFTDLNMDKEAFEGYKTKQKGFISNMLSMPSMYFSNELYSYLNKENPRYLGFPKAEDYDNADYELAYKIYKERFANAGDFNFYFVGNVDEAKLIEYSELYLASLPAKKDSEKAIDLGYRMLKGEHKKIINKGKDPKSTVNIMFYGDCKYDAKEDFALNALAEVLTIKLVEELRENESGVYGVGARGNMNKVPAGSFSFSINFPCGPENAETLTASALRELNKIIENGPEQKDVDKFIEAEKLDYKKKIKENSFWMSNLTSSYMNDNNPEEILNYEAKVKAITPKEIQAVAKKYLTKEKVIAILMPEE
ncbi:insulinase family protein [Flavobacterium sediminilitoris]|uniref:Insulinase family protein n=1 Tax=Flavobacterium sediminilitoris TaxID=2024526 RepID=A0ABY4HP68_9FLAO|nr:MULTISPECIES: M16 family metallopeptidase [Flavobacterium]UOX34385.1 insulinase family protein [Flavobacterium sediminilitoris]